jgi:hypothetical protein
MYKTVEKMDIEHVAKVIKGEAERE